MWGPRERSQISKPVLLDVLRTEAAAAPVSGRGEGGARDTVAAFEQLPNTGFCPKSGPLCPVYS